MGWIVIINLRRQPVLEPRVLCGLPGDQKSDQFALLLDRQMCGFVFQLRQRHESTLLPDHSVVNPVRDEISARHEKLPASEPALADHETTGLPDNGTSGAGDGEGGIN